MKIKKYFSFLRPEFFDIFGFFVWIFFITTSIYTLVTGHLIKPVLIITLIIGVLGIIIDSYIVYKTYIKK